MTRIVCLFFLLIQHLTFGQTVLASVSMDLKNSQGHHRAIQFANDTTGELFIVAADKSKMQVVKLNSALFVRDTMQTLRPSAKYDFIAGHCFTSHNPEIYWMSEDMKQVFAVQVDVEKAIASTTEHTLIYDNESYLGHFNTNDAFYVITVDHQEADLHFYEFSSGRVRQNTVNLKAELLRPTDNSKALRATFDEHALVKIDPDHLNPLFYCTAKVKYYVAENVFRLTADHERSETIVIDIDLNTFGISSKKIPQPQLSKPGDSNSFLLDNMLYQVKVNKEQINVSVTDLASAETFVVIDESNSAEIAQRNSPLLSQTGNQSARTIKNTERFLKTLASALPGISVYQTPDSKLVTIGGISYVASSGDILLGVAAGVGMVLSGTDLYLDGMIPSENLRTVFYETHLGDDLKYRKNEQQILAADKISMFFDSENGESLISTIRYKDYFICGYYNDRENLYVIRKFSDVHD